MAYILHIFKLNSVFFNLSKRVLTLTLGSFYEVALAKNINVTVQLLVTFEIGPIFNIKLALHTHKLLLDI